MNKKLAHFCEGIMWTGIVCLLIGRHTKDQKALMLMIDCRGMGVNEAASMLGSHVVLIFLEELLDYLVTKCGVLIPY
jgi:hypothetical protein